MVRKILFAVVVGCLIYGYVGYWSLKRSEHGGIIRQVITCCIEYVNTSGKWPASWAELETIDPTIDWDFIRQICKIDFTVDCKMVAATSVESFDAIYPLKQSWKPETEIKLLIAACANNA